MEDKQESKIFILLERFRNGGASEQDLSELESWYDSFDQQANFTDNLSPSQKIENRELLLKRIHTQIAEEPAIKHAKPSTIPLWKRLLVASTVLLIPSTGIYFALNSTSGPSQLVQQKGVDFEPGSNKAILTLSSGENISITEAMTGELARDGNSLVEKTNDGKLIYKRNGKVITTKAVLNTMTTPRAAQFHMILSDGTHVWLNAASSITYPTLFEDNSREVTVKGEVYFQVAHRPDKPFRVISKGQIVQVLGTHFNINAYENELSVKTTLTEGSIMLIAGSQKKVLKPGQQSSIIAEKITVSTVNPEEITAWKDGFFDFTDADIQTVMRQFARWYDVDIEFEGPVTKDTFTGRLPRSLSLVKVIKMMQSVESVHLSAKGRRVMVK